jgi:hypothetical protein
VGAEVRDLPLTAEDGGDFLCFVGVAGGKNELHAGRMTKEGAMTNANPHPGAITA